jgi:hypothetical protein
MEEIVKQEALFFRYGPPIRVMAIGTGKTSVSRKNAMVLIALVAIMALATTAGDYCLLVGTILLMVILAQLVLIIVNAYKSANREIGRLADVLAVYKEYIVVNSKKIENKEIVATFMTRGDPKGPRPRNGIGFIMERDNQRDAKIFWIDVYDDNEKFLDMIKEKYENVFLVDRGDFLDIWEKNRTIAIPLTGVLVLTHGAA